MKRLEGRRGEQERGGSKWIKKILDCSQNSKLLIASWYYFLTTYPEAVSDMVFPWWLASYPAS